MSTTIPIDNPTCIAAGKDVVAIGGTHAGKASLAIHYAKEWAVIDLGSRAAIVEPQVFEDWIIASVPDEDAILGTASIARAAGSVYLATRGQGLWSLSARIVASEPREMGLFGIRVGRERSRILVNHYVGKRGADAVPGVVDGSIEVCDIDASVLAPSAAP